MHTHHNLPAYWSAEVLTTLHEIEAFEEMPLTQRGLPVSTYRMLMDGCAIEPQKTAVHYFSDGSRPLQTAVEVSFAELRRKVHQTANLLHALGVRRDDVVSLMLPAVPQAVFALCGAQAAGIVNPVNWMLEPGMLVHALRAARTKVIFVFVGRDSAALWQKLLVIAPELPDLAAIVRVGAEQPPAELPARVRVLDFELEVERHRDDALDSARQFAPEDIAALFHTGGTTGAPKLAPLSHRNLVFWSWASRHLAGFGSEEIRLVGVPVFHVAGAIVSCFSPLVRGASIVLMTATGFRHPSVLPNLWRIVEAYRASMLTLVPTLVNQALLVPVDGADISSLVYTASSTAPLSPTVAEAFFAKTGLRIRESWGMTETTAVTCITPAVPDVKVGSSGLRLPYQGVRVVQVDAGGIAKDCAPDEPGLVIVRGPAVFPGYLGAPEAARWFDGDWLDTGDLGFLDAQGWLWITGRAKDLIIRGGHNIDPKMVEEALYSIDALQDVAVVGAPDAHAGEVPVAYVVLKPGAAIAPEDILAVAAQRVPERAAVPKRCFVIAEMPKTLVGKIQKNVLRVDAIQCMFAEALQAAGAGAHALVTAHERGNRGYFVDIRLDQPKASFPRLDELLRPFTVSWAITETESS